AVLRIKLPTLDEMNVNRRAAAERYSRLLSRVPGVVVPHTLHGAEPVYHMYVVQVPQRDQVRGLLKVRGIETGVYDPVPLHLQPANARLDYRPENYPIASAVNSKILSLPISPEITSEQIDGVVNELQRAVAIATLLAVKRPG